MPTLLILGSNSDVGKACAYHFARQKFNLILATRNLNEAQEHLAADLRIRFEVEVSLVHFDAKQYESHKAFYENLLPKPDVVLSVFGYLGDQKLAKTDFAEAYQIMNANYCGHVSILDIIVEDMVQQGGGTIIGVSSVAGDRGRASNYHYGAAKAGFTAYLSGLRQRLSNSHVHIATVIPGFIQTKMLGDLKTPALLTAKPEQVAKAIWSAYQRKQNTVYTLSVWWLIMKIIKAIPEFIFKRLPL